MKYCYFCGKVIVEGGEGSEPSVCPEHERLLDNNRVCVALLNELREKKELAKKKETIQAIQL